MLWFVIASVIFLVITILLGILDTSSSIDLEAPTGVCGALIFILLIIGILSPAFVDIFDHKSKYQVVYEEKELKVVDESIYTLKITERVSYSFFKKGIKVYQLYKNTDLVKQSKNINDIKEYFELKQILVIGG